MSSDKDKSKKFKVLQFVGDYFSSKGERRKWTVIVADSEEEAEYIFKKQFANCSFGWIEEFRKD